MLKLLCAFLVVAIEMHADVSRNTIWTEANRMDGRACPVAPKRLVVGSAVVLVGIDVGLSGVGTGFARIVGVVNAILNGC